MSMFPPVSLADIIATHPLPWRIISMPRPGQYTMADAAHKEVQLPLMLQYLEHITQEHASKARAA